MLTSLTISPTASALHVRQNAIPQALTSPPIQPIRVRLPGSISLGQVPTGRSGAHLQQHAVDDPALISPLATTPAAPGQQWFNRRPRALGQLPPRPTISLPPFRTHTGVAHRLFVRQTLIQRLRSTRLYHDTAYLLY
jgi:hypothetical protein